MANPPPPLPVPDGDAPRPVRKIIHVDMDAFFASVEQRDRPDLRGRPVAVGGTGGRGVVAAASYEARAFGVRSAMPSATARRLCPDLIFCKARFDVYRAVSEQIRAIFHRFTDLVEPLSLDEAYLDVTADAAAMGSAVATAREIRRLIRHETQLTASAGVATNKFLAKLASDHNKPDGLCVIRPGEGEAFVRALPVRRFHGVGPRGAEKMARLGIVTGADLAARDAGWLRARFGSFGDTLYRAARGIDDRPVRPHRTRKSIGAERTFAADLFAPDALREALEAIVAIVWDRIAEQQARGRTVTVKLKFRDFTLITRARSLPRPITDRAAFAALAGTLLDEQLPLAMPIRLLGVTLSALYQPAEDEEEAVCHGAEGALPSATPAGAQLRLL